MTLAMQRFSQGRGTNLYSGADWLQLVPISSKLVQPVTQPAQVSQTWRAIHRDLPYRIRSLRLSFRFFAVQSFEAFELCTEIAVLGRAAWQTFWIHF
eukprot:s779_g8.t1